MLNDVCSQAEISVWAGMVLATPTAVTSATTATTATTTTTVTTHYSEDRYNPLKWKTTGPIICLLKKHRRQLALMRCLSHYSYLVVAAFIVADAVAVVVDVVAVADVVVADPVVMVVIWTDDIALPLLKCSKFRSKDD